jgi:hypothetical protein
MLLQLSGLPDLAPSTIVLDVVFAHSGLSTGAMTWSLTA